ncbi:unnamed protein product [Notodromas monacha]|uniref:RING-CH-type domain-containing protein n=1 Tax=Notodromas monacha TaxID=399045 RepID=A0A7R9BLD0_9CRUS|nr:unnamed protein product [Notodromas monacha]CAG0917605.1 unnamed protein product [Notodromas monacha]
MRMPVQLAGPSLGSLRLSNGGRGGGGGGGLMSFLRMSVCQGNCSGRGDCLDGVCFCEVEFGGDACQEPNRNYFIAFASIFYVMCAVSMGQLLVYTWAEFQRMKAPSFRIVFRPTVQKSLYFIIFLASALRAAYFSAQDTASSCWASSLLGAYYAVLLTGSSLIVCFWAEVFHLPGMRCERPRFLGKSTMGFLAFNGITYTLLLVEVVVLHMTPDEATQLYLVQIFNSGYAVLMFIVVIFFLIYGVEVYFKVRGGFLRHTRAARLNRKQSSRVLMRKKKKHSEADETAANPEELSELKSTTETAAVASPSFIELPVTPIPAVQTALEEMNKVPLVKLSLDSNQLQQSRFGLVFQAVILLATVCFLLSDILGDFWKDKVPVVSRNWHAVVFRLLELAAALWFPCVLWNCIRPDELWILNPKKIIKFVPNPTRFNARSICRNGASFDSDVFAGWEDEVNGPTAGSKDSEVAKADRSDGEVECWICYDADAGPLIHPCNCRGGVGAVHHDCLKRWLVELAGAVNLEEQQLCCRVCGAAYQVEVQAPGAHQLLLRSGSVLVGGGCDGRHWAQKAGMVVAMVSASAGTWAAFQLPEATTWIKLSVTGFAAIVYYVCLRFMGFSVFKAYYEARVRGIKILDAASPQLAPQSPCDGRSIARTSIPETVNILDVRSMERAKAGATFSPNHVPYIRIMDQQLKQVPHFSGPSVSNQVSDLRDRLDQIVSLRKMMEARVALSKSQSSSAAMLEAANGSLAEHIDVREEEFFDAIARVESIVMDCIDMSSQLPNGVISEEQEWMHDGLKTISKLRSETQLCFSVRSTANGTYPLSGQEKSNLHHSVQMSLTVLKTLQNKFSLLRDKMKSLTGSHYTESIASLSMDMKERYNSSDDAILPRIAAGSSIVRSASATTWSGYDFADGVEGSMSVKPDGDGVQQHSTRALVTKSAEFNQRIHALIGNHQHIADELPSSTCSSSQDPFADYVETALTADDAAMIAKLLCAQTPAPSALPTSDIGALEPCPSTDEPVVVGCKDPSWWQHCSACLALPNGPTVGFHDWRQVCLSLHSDGDQGGGGEWWILGATKYLILFLAGYCLSMWVVEYGLSTERTMVPS